MGIEQDGDGDCDGRNRLGRRKVLLTVELMPDFIAGSEEEDLSCKNETLSLSLSRLWWVVRTDREVRRRGEVVKASSWRLGRRSKCTVGEIGSISTKFQPKRCCGALVSQNQLISLLARYSMDPC